MQYFNNSRHCIIIAIAISSSKLCKKYFFLLLLRLVGLLNNVRIGHWTTHNVYKNKTNNKTQFKYNAMDQTQTERRRVNKICKKKPKQKSHPLLHYSYYSFFWFKTI